MAVGDVLFGKQKTLQERVAENDAKRDAGKKKPAKPGMHPKGEKKLSGGFTYGGAANKGMSVAEGVNKVRTAGHDIIVGKVKDKGDNSRVPQAAAATVRYPLRQSGQAKPESVKPGTSAKPAVVKQSGSAKPESIPVKTKTTVAAAKPKPKAAKPKGSAGAASNRDLPGRTLIQTKDDKALRPITAADTEKARAKIINARGSDKPSNYTPPAKTVTAVRTNGPGGGADAVLAADRGATRLSRFAAARAR